MIPLGWGYAVLQGADKETQFQSGLLNHSSQRRLTAVNLNCST